MAQESPFFISHLWAAWLLLALICAILEITVPYFTFALASVAAGAAAIIALQGPVVVQLLTFGAVLILSLFFVRPKLIKKFQREHKMPSRSQALVGHLGELTEAVDPTSGTGRVSVAGHDWAARSASPIAVGKAVVVRGHDGIVLIVEEK